jgi:hypothetical protein
MESIFKKGDTVFSGTLSGVVRTEVGAFIDVVFENEEKESYCKDNGKRYQNDIMPTLSFTPYIIEQNEQGILLKGFTQERPFNPQKGDLVLASNDGEKWFLKEYLCFKDSSDWSRHEVKQYHTEDDDENLANYKYCKLFKQD